MLGNDEFQAAMNKDGIVLFPSVVAEPMLERLRHDLEIVYAINRRIQKENGVDFEGVAHHIVKSLWRGGSFADLLEDMPLRSYVEAYFVKPFIMNAISGLLNLPHNSSAVYQHRPHRDMRSYFPVRLSLNFMLMLDDFTEANGATHILKGSHLQEAMPSNDEFFAKSERLLGKAGDIALFNSDMVHSAGQNKTDKVRRCIAITFVRPFMRPQCDYTTLLTDTDSEWLKQLLGYNSRVPKDLNEWYQPLEKRTYKSNQG